MDIKQKAPPEWVSQRSVKISQKSVKNTKIKISVLARIYKNKEKKLPTYKSVEDQ